MASHGLPGIIGFDGSRIASATPTGTESYADELLNALAPQTEPGELRVYLNDNQAPSGLPTGIDATLIPAPRLWTHARLSWEISRRPPALLFVPSHVIPAFHPRTVVTIHDLAFLKHPEAFPMRQRRELDLSTKWNARVSAKIIAVSRRTKNDLIEHYGVDPGKIVVVHHGVSRRFRPASIEAVAQVREKHGLPDRYILCVGTLHPRKNYPAVVAAFGQAVDSGLDAGLVICGTDGRYASSTHQAIATSAVRERIHWLRYVDQTELPALYSGAALVMLASLYEGFGMPALEAMSCGAPVAVSSTGALPEVAGSGARYVDPLDIESMANVMLETWSSPQLGHRLATLGRQWAGRFTWERSASLTLSVLRAVRDNREIDDDRLGWHNLAESQPQPGIDGGSNS